MTLFDQRNRGDGGKPVARYEFAQLSWADGVTAADTETLSNLNGLCEQIKIVVSNATNGITVTVAITDPDGGSLVSVAAIAENATTFLKATSDASDFDAFLLSDGTYTLTVTPSGDPGTSGVTVDVDLYLR